jgi:hypothetical protein
MIEMPVRQHGRYRRQAVLVHGIGHRFGSVLTWVDDHARGAFTCCDQIAVGLQRPGGEPDDKHEIRPPG